MDDVVMKNVSENTAESAPESTPESASEESAVELRYHYLPPGDWPLVLPLLSYSAPGRPVALNTLDPSSQSIIAVSTPEGQIVAAAIVSGVFHVAYLIPATKEVNILTMQGEVERLLPPRSTYYTMVGDGPEADVMRDELGMVKIEGGPVMFTKRTMKGEEL